MLFEAVTGGSLVADWIKLKYDQKVYIYYQISVIC